MTLDFSTEACREIFPAFGSRWLVDSRQDALVGLRRPDAHWDEDRWLT